MRKKLLRKVIAAHFVNPCRDAKRVDLKAVEEQVLAGHEEAHALKRKLMECFKQQNI